MYQLLTGGSGSSGWGWSRSDGRSGCRSAAAARAGRPRGRSATTLSNTASATASLPRARRGVRPSARGPSRRWCRGRSPRRGRRRRWPPSGRHPWPPAWPPARSATSSVSAAKPTSTWPAVPRPTQLGEDVGVGSRTRSGTPSDLWSLDVAISFGRKSATAAAITTTSAPSANATMADSISAAVSTGWTATPSATGRPVAVVTRSTWLPVGPRRRPERGPACRRNGWSGSGRGRWARGFPRPRSPPTPARSPAPGEGRGRPCACHAVGGHGDGTAYRRPSSSSTVATITSGSASRPAPASPPARRPSSGGTTSTPRDRSVARFCLDRRVLPHLGVHGRAHHHGGRRGHQRGGQQVVGQAVGVASR